MLKELVNFRGMRPRVNPTLLPDTVAQLAMNCTLWNGDLRSMKQPLPVVTPSPIGQTIKSIYRIGMSLPEDQYWLAWAGDVDVVRGLVAGDTSERTYYTGAGAPKVTNLQLATQGGTTYPVNSYTLGVPAPLNAPTCAASNTTAPAETRVYLYTYVSSFGEEGAPCHPTKVVVSQSGTVTLTGMSAAPTGNFNILSKRIYRSTDTSNGVGVYRFVAEIPVANTSYVDSLTTTQLGEVLTTLDYSMPPSTMAGLVAMPNGILAGFDGYDIYFCEPFLPYAWPTKYRLTADFPVVGLGVYGTSLVVCTKGSPYIITGVDPASMSMERIEIDQACISKRSIVSVGGGVMYASPDGLVYVGGGGSQIVTKNHYTRDEWQAINPSGISGYLIDGKYIAVYANGGGFILDSIEDSELTYFDDVITAGYLDRVNDTLYLCIAGSIKKFNAGVAKTFTWRSKKYQMMGHRAPGAARVDADAYPVTLKLYYLKEDGQTDTFSKTVNSALAFRLPGGFRLLEMEIELSGTNPIRYAAVADTIEELQFG